ncbi:metallophosphoesterase [Paenibacillus castaneae]|uniref:metallophosphoesterase n=1 Tax=Paenibacillus castaneae TaxID=474957 RepID=UPI0011AF31DE|nr:metallophosphoesterase [Paenibacillus castaneae]
MRVTKKRLFYIIPMLIIVLVAFLYYENNAISITRFQASSSKLPEAFDGYRIVQLTDLHSKLFGRNQERLVSKVKKLRPDIIVVTGDLVDSRRYDAEVSLTLMREIAKLAPVYYVTGNHERSSGKYMELEKGLNSLGIHVMRNKSEMIKLGQGEIRLAGVDDPTFNTEADGDVDKISGFIDTAMQETAGADAYTVLLSHRPELFAVYMQKGIDITFSGHAHGGQVRLPFVGGLVAPGQGFLPKYDAGKFVDGQSTLIVSRGLGNSIIPQRLFNRPEVVLVELMHANE